VVVYAYSNNATKSVDGGGARALPDLYPRAELVTTSRPETCGLPIGLKNLLLMAAPERCEHRRLAAEGRRAEL